MANNFFQVMFCTAPITVPFFALAGIFAWICDRLVERSLSR